MCVEVNKGLQMGKQSICFEKPVYIILDHPFVYAIVDNKTNLPVFVGCINTIE